MPPKYQIFASLLTGTWMPWLENNRQPGRFDHLLQSTDAFNGKSCSHFFKVLTGQTGCLQSPAMQRFRQEANYLVKVCTHAVDKGGAAFFGLSATTTRLQFYNRLIGYSFNGYHSWATELFADSNDAETSNWDRMRMARTLLDLLKIPVACHHATHSERVIACRARAAMCILHHRLTTAGNNQPGAIPPAINLRDALHACLDAFTLEASAREEITGLFDALTADKLRAPTPFTHAHASTVAPEAPSSLPADDLFTSTLKAVKMDIDVMKQVMEHLCNAAHPQNKKVTTEPELLLDSATVLKRLSISKTSLQRYREKGKLPFTKIGGKYCYWEKDITNIIEKGKNQKK